MNQRRRTTSTPLQQYAIPIPSTMSLQSAIKRSSTRLKSSHIQSFSTCTSPLRAAHNFLSSTTRPTPIGDLDILLNDHDKNQRDSLPKTPERDDESFKLAHKLTDATFGKTTHKSSRSATSGNSTYGGGGSTFLEVERGITRTEKKLDFETTKQQSRNWREGDVFGPRDLGPGEMRKWKKSQRPTRDVFDILNVDPMDEYKVRYLSLPLRRLNYIHTKLRILTRS